MEIRFKESERSVRRTQPKGRIKMICCFSSGLFITKVLCNPKVSA